MSFGTKSNYLALILILLVTLAGFGPSLGGGFLNWDDIDNLVTNPYFRVLDQDSAVWFFTTSSMGDYKPLTWLSYAFDYAFWQLNPVGYHLGNLLLHSLNGWLFYFCLLSLIVCFRLRAGSSRAFRIAVIFATLWFVLHPLRVESAAWITERKGLLSSSFFFLSLLSYLRYATARRGKIFYYGVSLCAAFLAFFSKPLTVTLPILLFLLDLYPLRGRKSLSRAVLEKLPFLAGAVLAGLLALRAQGRAGFLIPLEQFGAFDRLSLVARNLVFYLAKIAWPFRLLPIYPFPEDSRPYLGSLAVLIALILLSIRYRRAGRGVGPFVFLWYLLAILPASGFFAAGQQVAADRFTYLPSFGPAVLITLGIASLARKSRKRSAEVSALAGILLALWTTQTRRQTGLWRDSLSLWSYAVAANPQSELAVVNLGNVYRDRGELSEAVVYYRRALELNPDYELAHNNLGLTLADQGKFAEAIEHYRLALKTNPRYARVYLNWGVALAGWGKPEEAKEYFRKSLRLSPEIIGAHYNLGTSLLDEGRLAEAVEEFEISLARQPYLEATYLNLGYALINLGEFERAISTWEKGIEVFPGHPGITTNLIWVMATAPDERARNAPRAVQLAEDTCRRYGYGSSLLLDPLAAAYANAGRFDEAVEAAEKALELAEASGNEPLATGIRSRLKLYRSNQPYRSY